MSKRHPFHWTQEGALYVDLLFKRQITRGFRALDKHINLDDIKLLDAGCGDGQLSRTLAENFGVQNVWGCDIDPNDIANCQTKNPAIHYFVHDLLTPFEISTKFDVILFTAALAQFSQQQQRQVLNNAIEQLTPDGVIWMIDVNTQATKYLFTQEMAKHNIIYVKRFSKSLFNHYSVLKLADKLPLTVLHLLDNLCIGSNVLTQAIIQPKRQT